MRSVRGAARAGALGLSMSLAMAGVPAASWAQAPAVVPRGAAGARSLDPLLAPLGDKDAGARREAADTASALGPDQTAAIGDALAELRKANSAGERAALHAATDRGGDLVATLLDLSARRAPDTDLRAALVEVCLLRSLARIGDTPAARLLVLASDDAGGELRKEASRLVKQLGDRAVPALVEARLLPSSSTKQWAANMLDALGKHLPSDAVQTKDERALPDILRAYGAVRDLDALPIILNFANAERAPLRTAARDAVLLYGQDAMWKLREQYQAVTGGPAAEGTPAADLAAALFAAFDKVRLEEVYALLDDGLAKQRLADLPGAVADFDRVLARQPALDRRGEMVPGYVEYARSIEDADGVSARGYLERALSLGPDDLRRAQAESELDLLDGRDLEARGVSGADAFRRAVALDPGNAKAADELARASAASDGRQTSLERGVAAGAAVAVGIAAAILFAGKNKTKRAGPRKRAPASS